MALTQTKTYGRQTKLGRLCEQISLIAHELGPEAKLPTIIQLRDTLGVSVATIDSALRELEQQNVIYRRHGVGIYVSSKLYQKTVCLVCDPTFIGNAGASPFWNMLLNEAWKRAETGGESCTMHFGQPYRPDSPLLQENLMADISAGKVDGVLSIGLLRPAIKWLMEHHVPSVSFAGPGECEVRLNGAGLLRMGTESLLEQGCRRIGAWGTRSIRPGDDPPRPISDLRLALEEVLLARNIPFYEELLHEDRPISLDPTTQIVQDIQEVGYLTAMEVFGDPAAPKPDGIVIGDDVFTSGALTALQKLGVRVGEDVKIASHTNKGSSVLLGQADHITLLEIDPAEIVREMFSMLEARMDGREPASRLALISPVLKS